MVMVPLNLVTTRSDEHIFFLFANLHGAMTKIPLLLLISLWDIKVLPEEESRFHSIINDRTHPGEISVTFQKFYWISFWNALKP